MKKFVLITFALIGLAVAQFSDSATQGPNPQDIATPEPEYIDIDVQEPASGPAPAPAPAPAQIQQRVFSPVPLPMAHPVHRPIVHQPRSIFSQQYIAPQQSYHIPVQQQHQQIQGHVFSPQSGYQYRSPVYYRRVYRQRRY